MNKRKYYALFDVEKMKEAGTAPSGVFEIELSQAESANMKGYGIFWTVNEFEGRRKLENLKKINSWYCETDGISKEFVISRIFDGLIPSLVVESKNGFHIYWDAEDATVNNYEQIQERLIAFFNADKGVKDLARVLRVPGFYHLKDASNPFLVRTVFESGFKYKEKTMQYFFAVEEKQEKEIKQRQLVREALKDYGGQAVWSYFINMNCEYALSVVSGSSAVNNEIFSFKPGSKNTKQIYVNNKRSQCWIDADGKIGSHSNGGPGIFNWIKWYGYSNGQVADILREYFPEGFKK